jgi:hypothetical protein
LVERLHEDYAKEIGNNKPDGKENDHQTKVLMPMRVRRWFWVSFVGVVEWWWVTQSVHSRHRCVLVGLLKTIFNKMN